MSGYTLAQKAKSVAAQVGAVCTVVLSICAYVITEAAVDDNVKAWAATVAGVVGLVGSVATRVVTFKIPNAPVADAPPPPDVELEGTH